MGNEQEALESAQDICIEQTVECADIVACCMDPLGRCKQIIPMPGGGISFDSIAAMTAFYGNDTIFLMGSGLYTHGPDPEQNCSNLVGMITDICRRSNNHS